MRVVFTRVIPATIHNPAGVRAFVGNHKGINLPHPGEDECPHAYAAQEMAKQLGWDVSGHWYIDNFGHSITDVHSVCEIPDTPENMRSRFLSMNFGECMMFLINTQEPALNAILSLYVKETVSGDFMSLPISTKRAALMSIHQMPERHAEFIEAFSKMEPGDRQRRESHERAVSSCRHLRLDLLQAGYKEDDTVMVIFKQLSEVLDADRKTRF